uniref:Uncharacterized protein n=1 Tax=Setaria italica TaxID=4555 RepID=K4AM26_SETIT
PSRTKARTRAPPKARRKAPTRASRWASERGGGGGRTETAMEGWTPRRHRFWLRAEIEVDRGSSILRGPGFGFAAVVREPLVKLRRPQYDFEGWDWDYFSWPHDRLDANLEMRDGDPEATLEADQKAIESFLNQSMLQPESYDMYQHKQEQHTAALPRDHLKVSDRFIKKQFLTNLPVSD